MPPSSLRRPVSPLLTSRNEGQPLALMESLGRGCPPVSYDIRYGPSDVIEDSVNGFLVPAQDIAAAAERVVKLCTDPELARAMGQAAWESSEQFSDPAVVGQWLTSGQAWRQVPIVCSCPDGILPKRSWALPTPADSKSMGELTWRRELRPRRRATAAGAPGDWPTCRGRPLSIACRGRWNGRPGRCGCTLGDGRTAREGV